VRADGVLMPREYLYHRPDRLLVPSGSFFMQAGDRAVSSAYPESSPEFSSKAANHTLVARELLGGLCMTGT